MILPEENSVNSLHYLFGKKERKHGKVTYETQRKQLCVITPHTLRAEEERLAATSFSYPQFVRLAAMNMMKIWKKSRFIANV